MLFKIYGKPDCLYCIKAKDLLQSLELPYQYLCLENGEWDKHTLEKQLQVVIITVPQITYGNRYIGGFRELEDFILSI